uniref:Uncharacterized protein n=1 Tax=Amphimedon queenslandica TaxID=400682 RepID=A0A1X7T2V5_AMPQE
MTWAQDVAPDDEERLQELQYYAITSLLYSAIMAFHVVCMGFTNYIRSKDEVLGDGDLTDMHIFLLGVAEILYRLHFIYKNYSLIYMHRNPPMPRSEEAVHDGRDGQPVVARMPAPVAPADNPTEKKDYEFTYQAAIMMVGLTIFDAIVIGRYF